MGGDLGMIDYGWSVNEVATTIASVVAAFGALLLVFKRVRDWIGVTIWTPIKSLFSARTELKTEFKQHVEKLRGDIETAIGQHFAKFHGDLSDMKSTMVNRFTVIDCKRHAAADEDHTSGTIECDKDGNAVWASRPLMQWMDATREDFDGSRWQEFIAEAERSNIRAEVKMARDLHQTLRKRVHMGPHGEKPSEYHMVMSPLPDKKPALEWLIRFRPVAPHE
jgi:hypothetical protein